MTYTVDHFGLLLVHGRLKLLLKKGDKILVNKSSNQSIDWVMKTLERLNYKYQKIQQDFLDGVILEIA
jgi:hypothetical protein